MQVAAIEQTPYIMLGDDECEARIVAAKQALGERLVILGHHYQRDEVFRHADYSGDSLKLSRQAANSKAEYIIFCGVPIQPQTSKRSAALTAASSAPLPMHRMCLNGRSGSAKKSCSSPTSTWAATPASKWVSRSTKWWCGILTNPWAV